MTDKKALEVLENWLHLAYHNADGTDECSAELYEALQTTFKLITRQKAEIKKLKEDNFIKSQKRANIFEIVDAYERGKSEAVKEFVERLKKVWWDNRYDSPDVDFDDFIDSLVKEMGGDKK